MVSTFLQNWQIKSIEVNTFSALVNVRLYSMLSCLYPVVCVCARPCFFMCLYGMNVSAYMHTYVHTYTYNLHVGSDTLVTHSEAPRI